MEELKAWHALNSALKVADAGHCLDLIEREVAGDCRLRVLLRIHARYNKVRAHEERRSYLRIAEERGVVNPGDRARVEGGGHG